jgi:hypothetical protein
MAGRRAVVKRGGLRDCFSFDVMLVQSSHKVSLAFEGLFSSLFVLAQKDLNTIWQ